MAKQQLTPEYRAFLEEAGKRICKEMSGSVHSVEGIPMATLRYPESGNGPRFKKKELMAGQELELTETYVGKSGKLIFCFSPCDKRDWEAVELDAKTLDTVLPLFGGELAGKMQSDSEAFPVLLEELIVEIEILDKERKEAEEVAKQVAYDNHPNFGRF